MSERPHRGNTIRNREREKTPSRNSRQLKIDWDRILDNPRSVLIVGMFFIILSVFLELSFISYLFSGYEDQSIVNDISAIPLQELGRYTSNMFGLLGAVVAQIFVYRWFGIASMLLPVISFLAGLKLAFNKEPFPLGKSTKILIFLTLFISTLIGYIISLTVNYDTAVSYLSGGFGYTVNTWLESMLGYATILPIIFALFSFIIIFFNIRSLDSLAAYFSRKKELVREEYGQEGIDSTAEKEEAPEVGIQPAEIKKPKNTYREFMSQTYEDDESAEVIIEETEEEPPINVAKKPEPVNDDFEVVLPPIVPASNNDPHSLQIELNTDSEPLVPLMTSDSAQEDISDKMLREFGQYDPTIDLPNYMYPGVDLLSEVQESSSEKVSQDELESNKIRIVETLGSYGINISKIKATIGPTVTLYEIIPEAGVRISKIKNLEGDIALSLSAMGIRIIAPMPGRGTIGIEVPNKNRETVFIRSVLSNERFTKAGFELPVVLGKTISNDIYVADLAKMPHLLMAGATGQGKSVGLNVILTSLIYKKHPSQLKFVLVDPKKVELTLFNKLERHFLAKLPNSEEAIITDTKKVIYTLNSLCIEMDSRYDLLKEAAVKNIKEYNAKYVQRRLNPQKGHQFLPYIVLVIDELADLMMTAGKEVETPIARLAQLARAVGIHLVVATQRPSVKVITGLIKANFPARLSYKVTSSIDSRTILDAGGAEQLVGQGDMLLSINSDIIRLQCPFIDTDEIEDVCEYIGSQRGYTQAYPLPEFEGDENGDGKGELDVSDFDNLLPDAARLIVTHQQGSTSLIQRKMKLGYNRAGRIMDQLEATGIVGPFTGSKPREVLFMDLDQLNTHLRSIGIE